MAGNKKKKKSDPSRKERQKTKLTKKETKKTQKLQKRSKAEDSEEEEDIDAILADFAASQKAAVAISEEVCGLPSRRAVGSFVANPVNLNELILFGGMHFSFCIG
jgi:hypothetical protein